MTAAFALGFLAAGLHWWQFARQSKLLSENLSVRRVLWSTAGRWALTIALGIICQKMVHGRSGDFLTGFLVATFAARAASLLARKRAKTQQRGVSGEDSLSPLDPK